MAHLKASEKLPNRLQWRIWLAVMAAVILTTVLVSVLMRHVGDSQRPRYLQIRDAQGRIIGQTQVMPRRPNGNMSVLVQTADGQTLEINGCCPAARSHLYCQTTVPRKNYTPSATARPMLCVLANLRLSPQQNRGLRASGHRAACWA